MHLITNLITSTILFEPGETSVDVSANQAITEPARRNRANIIEGAQSVEQLLEQIVTAYFFPNDHEKAVEFLGLIVEADFFSFAVKKKLMLAIVERKKFLEGKTKNEYEKNLGDMMRYRNAFTHGKFSSNGKTVWLSYFEGGPKKQELTDDYLKKVERVLSNAFHETFALQQKLWQTHSPTAGS